MKIEDCLEKVKNDIGDLTKLKNKIDCLIGEYEIVKINKKYIRLLEKKDKLLECESKKCDSNSSSSESDRFWDKCHVENQAVQLLKIEKQLGATLSYYKFEKSKCNITSTDPSGNQIGFGPELYDAYKAIHPHQLYFYNLRIDINIFSHTIKIINTSTAENLNGEYTLYYVDDEQVDNRIFFGGCPHDECPIAKLYKKLKAHKHIYCEYDTFLEVLVCIVNTFPKLLGFKETENGFTEKACL
jgi:hypothetical protein